MIKRIFGLIVVSISLTSCYKDNEEELYPNSFTGNDTTTYTYAADIKPLMTANCAYSGCHIAGMQSPDLSTYVGLSGNIERVKARAITERTMPTSGPMASSDIAKLTNWINAGAKNN
ncbi:MAG: hypothetical protein K9H61_10030 [Bacteroidia bacterium]|nr:hypothetical protein [Bacteroidia bacterium]MCF8447320.1 hypothetical protein [Bacteroidia bacterium]